MSFFIPYLEARAIQPGGIKSENYGCWSPSIVPSYALRLTTLYPYELDMPDSDILPGLPSPTKRNLLLQLLRHVEWNGATILQFCFTLCILIPWYWYVYSFKLAIYSSGYYFIFQGLLMRKGNTLYLLTYTSTTLLMNLIPPTAYALSLTLCNHESFAPPLGSLPGSGLQDALLGDVDI